MLAGCTILTSRQFVLGDSSGRSEEKVWPAIEEGEPPRYRYLGELLGEPNFVSEAEGLASWRRWLQNLFEGLTGKEAPRRLDRPQAGVVDGGGRILVTDLGRGAVFVFDERSGHLEVWENAERNRPFIAPVGVALGRAGEVFVADADGGFIARLDRQGNPLVPIGKGELARPNGIAFDARRGRLYVVDTTAHQIKVFDAEGNLLARWGERGEAPGQFNFPTHVVLAGDRLYVSDTLNACVQILDAEDGRPLARIGKRGLFIGDLVRPKGVAVDGEGNLYVVESYFDHLLIYNREGQFLMAIGGVGSAPGKFHLPAGVWTDGRGRIFVADVLNGRVPVFQFLGGGPESE